MSTEQELQELRRKLGARRPATLSQQAHDFDDAHLRRLWNLEPDARPRPEDVWEYGQDIRYRPIEPQLFKYLLPMCLQAWRDDLHGKVGFGSFVEHLYPALADRDVFRTILTPQQTEVVSRFMRDSILAEIDEQRGLHVSGGGARPYRWIRALVTYGVLLPDIESLWRSWWGLDTIGRAVGAVQYVSALIHADDANPVFAPWTRDNGGGPPALWEFAGHLYTHRWQDENVRFLQQILNAGSVSDLLQRASARLAGEPESEMAARVLNDSRANIQRLTVRCAELPVLLGTTQDAGTLFAWSC